MLEINHIHQGDCLKLIKQLDNNSVDLVLTDIPYGEVNRESNGLRELNKGEADIMDFSLYTFLEQVFRVTKGTIIIFCGKEQVSTIHKFFAEKQKNTLGTVRQLIWEKTNPSPMNGEYIYLSGIENAVWFKKKGATFNAYCKNTVFRFPNGRNKLHPTEKNHNLLRELILDNSKEGDIILDPCCGSGAHCLVSRNNNRHFIGIELEQKYVDICNSRLREIQVSLDVNQKEVAIPPKDKSLGILANDL
jgi:DNA modification methylase